MYKLSYNYYQYNSGRGDNGFKSTHRIFDHFEVAQKEFNRIKWAIENREADLYGNDKGESESEMEDIKLIYLGYDGYFVSVKLVEYTETFVPIEEFPLT